MHIIKLAAAEKREKEKEARFVWKQKSKICLNWKITFEKWRDYKSNFESK